MQAAQHSGKADSGLLQVLSKAPENTLCILIILWSKTISTKSQKGMGQTAVSGRFDSIVTFRIPCEQNLAVGSSIIIRSVRVPEKPVYFV
jgi:hypothetical protein